MTNTENKKSWKEEFNDFIDVYCVLVDPVVLKEIDVKYFISSLLASRKEELLKEIKQAAEPSEDFQYEASQRSVPLEKVISLINKVME